MPPMILWNEGACQPASAQEVGEPPHAPEARAPLGNRLEADPLSAAEVSPEGQEGLKAFLEKRKPSWDK